MTNVPALISTGTLTRQTLAGQAAVVTGGGMGIGYEAARALAWLGCRAVIAEIDKRSGREAAERINQEMGEGMALFVQTDVGEESSVQRLKREAIKAYGKVDIVLNNATIAPLGAVRERSIQDWDASYRVNLRGPVLLAQAFLPGMLERKYGVFVCVSSVGGAYMAAYETFKSAQVELARTLEAELEGSGVTVFTIGPGIVATSTAREGVEQIARRYGKTPEEFFEMYKEHLITVEEAGAGFAAAIALPQRFRGLETYSKAGLIAAGIELKTEPVEEKAEAKAAGLNDEQASQALTLCREVYATLVKEHEGWKKRSLFERQWMLRDFKQYAGMPVDECLGALDGLEQKLQAGDHAGLSEFRVPVAALAGYYRHYQELTKSAVKDPQKLEEWLGTIQGWEKCAEELEELLVNGR